MKPSNLTTKIFLDSGNPSETEKIIEAAGFLDGQTTNPSLIAKNPETSGKKFSAEEINNFYKKIVSRISNLIPEGSVSVEVYADSNTSADEIIEQARKMYQWIPNAHIKIPITAQGLAAGKILSAEGVRLNFTLCFTQEQAAAVHVATRGAAYGQVYVSPFIGRLDDAGVRGMDLIQNIDSMLSRSVSHVQLLAASIRSLDHLIDSIKNEADIATVPYDVLVEWINAGMPLSSDVQNQSVELTPIEYKELSLSTEEWSTFNISHELTTKGLQKFADDWNSLIKND